MTGDGTRIAVVGWGQAARRHAESITKNHRATLAGCHDPRRAVSAALARAFGVPSFESLDALFDAPVDGVVVCTPPATRVAVVDAALARGLRALCENPLAPTTSDCESLADACGLACAFPLRHLSGAAFLRTHIAAGGLGRVISARAAAVSNVDMTGRWPGNPSLSGGGVLLADGVQLIDLCHYLLGPTQSVSAATRGGKRRLPVEESASIRLQMMCGATADIFVSWEAPGPKPPLLEIWGTEGYARLGADCEILDREGKTVSRWIADPKCVGPALIDNFVAFVRDEAAPSARFEDGFAAVAVAEAAYMSAVTQVSESPSLTPVFGR